MKPTTEQPTVYIVQEVDGRSFLPAQRFGALQLLMENNRRSIHLNPTPVIRELDEKLQDAKPGDYLVPAGNPTAIAIAAVLLALRTQGQFRVLQWDNRDHEYYVVDCDLSRYLEAGGVTVTP